MRKVLKRKIAKLLVLAITFGMLIVSGASNVEAKKVKPKLSKTSLTLRVGGEKEIKLKNATKKVSWKISNQKVLSNYSFYGSKNSICWIRASKAGKTTITAKCAGKKYKCKVMVKKWHSSKPTSTSKPEQKQISYGDISGNVTYHYNQYRGYVPDTGAKISVWKDGKLIQCTSADGNGNFKLQRLEVGKYSVMISSRNCNSSYVMENWDAYISLFGNNYSQLLNVAGSIHTEDNVQVYENYSTDVSYAFPYTDF